MGHGDKIGRRTITQQPTNEGISKSGWWWWLQQPQQRQRQQRQHDGMEVYCQRGAGCSLSPKQISAIRVLVAERSKAKVQRTTLAPTRYSTRSRESMASITTKGRANGPWSTRSTFSIPMCCPLCLTRMSLRQLGRGWGRGYSCRSNGTLTCEKNAQNVYSFQWHPGWKSCGLSK